MVLPASILLPLYIYPYPASLWQPLYDALSANPSVTFNVIVNPSSGPDTVPSTDQALSDYVPAVATLKSYSNAKLLGYVHTLYGEADTSTLDANITRWASWADNTQYDIAMDGIFFDEVVNEYSATSYSYLESAVNLARSSGLETIYFNPGTIAASEYFELADNIVMSENPYADMTSSFVAQLNALSASEKANSTIIIYSFPDDESEQNSELQSLIADGFGGIDITTSDGYEDWSDLWSEFASEVAAAV